MNVWLHVATGGVLALAAWLLPRHVAHARAAWSPATLLDIFPTVLGAGLLLIATGRPILAGLILFSLGGGLALADGTKRETLREPVVFSDMSELPQVFTHPQLYLPFAGTGLVVGGVLAAIAAGFALLVFEPGLWGLNIPLLFAACSIVWVAGWVLSREPSLSVAAAALRRLDPSGEPLEDAARLGPFALLLVYGVIARAERAARRARHTPPPMPALGQMRAAPAVPLVVVQNESFFDARRLSCRVPDHLLPEFDVCLQAGATFGRLDVSAWGANTMRTEFTVLTGIPEGDLGYDRFNPYHAFARAPIASLAWHLRSQGYRTLCLHPFDRGFFRRDLTLRALGFETFLGSDSLGGSRRPPYCPDPDLARHVLRAIETEGPRVFVFAITMGNHGPWQEAGPAIDPDLIRSFDPAGVPQSGELLRYLDGLRRSDEMLGILREGLERRHGDGILAFYGDHLPSLPRAFRHFGFDEWSSDYILWRGAGLPAHRLDLPAYRLPRVILDALRAKGAIDVPGTAAFVPAEGAA